MQSTATYGSTICEFSDEYFEYEQYFVFKIVLYDVLYDLY